MANRFWVGGTGTWDSTNTTSWSTTTGGGGGASVPTSSDIAIFDAASGGGTVTVAATINGTNSLQGITAGAFTGTLTFATNNPNITLTTSIFNVSGSGTRTINLGSGTFTLTATSGTVFDCSTTTNLTATFSNATIAIAPSAFGAVTFAMGGQTYGTLTISGTNAAGAAVTLSGSSGTLTNFNITAGPIMVVVSSAFTTTNAVSWVGSAAGMVTIMNPTSFTSATSLTMSSAGGTASWVNLRGFTFVTNSVTATDSYNLGTVTNASITNPSGGGVVGVIGG
jgi:hypothetical protein